MINIIPVNSLNNSINKSYVLDQMHRPLKDLRLSVTDRCNLRCVYCMPREVFDHDYPFLSSQSLLSFEQIQRIAYVFTRLGTEKIRLTGGEPLMRKEFTKLVSMLAPLQSSAGKPVELALTTNGVLLPKFAGQLKNSGLHRITISLDALEQDAFSKISGSKKSWLNQVLLGIDAAVSAGFDRLKINMVVRRGMNEDQVLPMLRHFRHTGHILRFIEYMDVGQSNGWRDSQVLTSKKLLDLIQEHYAIEPLQPNYVGEVAKRWSFVDGAGEFGVISSVSNPFCGECSRARMSPEGKLYMCLFANSGFDVRAKLHLSDDELLAYLSDLWQQREVEYSRRRDVISIVPEGARKIEMSYIGG